MIDDTDFPAVNRSLLLIQMKQPYVNWANNISDRSKSEKETTHTLENINLEPQSYLIPEISDFEDFESFIDHSWRLLFELQLSGWSTDEKLWPQKRTKKMFNEWFDIKSSSLVIDLWGKDALGYTRD